MATTKQVLRWIWQRGPAVGCIVVAAFVWPMALGGSTSYVTVSGHSMLPKLRDGDLVVTRTASDYRVGDVIAYRVPKGEVGAGALVIHRIVGGSPAAGFTTRGDNRTTNDLWHPRVSDVIGEKWAVVPGFGAAAGHLRNPASLAAFAALVSVMAAWGLVRRKPLVKASVAPPASAPDPPTSDVILVVDDESAFRRSVARMLTDSGYEVREADDGVTALDAVSAGLRPRLVLSDVLMPGLVGTNLSDRLEEHGIHNTILMSGHDVPGGHDRFLRKPFTEHELLDIVRRELEPT
jgi:signal peptidase I